MYRLVVKKCNIILDIERKKLPTTSSKHSIHCNGLGNFSIKGTIAIYTKKKLRALGIVSLRIDV